MRKLHVVIPIGVASPGTPIPEYLINSIESLKQQTFEDILITVAADENIPDNVKNILTEYGVNVEWFPPYSFFTKEGMWGKIFRCWEKYESEYVAFLHYDDIWEASKAQNQINFIEQNNLEGSWSAVYLIDDNNNIISGDSMRWTHFEKEYIKSFHPWICHATIINRNSILNSGILEYREKWTTVFENVFTAFLMKIKNVKKCDNAILCWRHHSEQMTHALGRDTSIDSNARLITQYDPEDCRQDGKYAMDNIDWQSIIDLY
jgi:hypothetical protein